MIACTTTSGGGLTEQLREPRDLILRTTRRRRNGVMYLPLKMAGSITTRP